MTDPLAARAFLDGKRLAEEVNEDRQTLLRVFDVTLNEDGDGRTLETRIVPFGEVAIVADPPTFEPYREEFLPGAFPQIRAADRVRVWLNFEHEPGLRGIVGHGLELEERDDGLHGLFRIHETADGEKALQLVRDGLLSGLSLEFASLKHRVREGVVQRLRVHLDRVSLCRRGAYQGAQVLAVRHAPDLPRPEPWPQELLAGLRHFGIATEEEQTDAVA